MTEPNENEKHLNAFLINNRELEELTARLSKFNIFDVLKATHAEIRHSNILAWLLTPDESHGIGDRFLRSFLGRVALENQDSLTHFKPVELELMKLENVEVRREWRNIDIYIHSPGQFGVIIENKVRSKESKDQLEEYMSKVRKIYGEDFRVLPILLTTLGELPSEKAQEVGYVSFSHIDILDILDSIAARFENRMTQEVQTLISHYRSTLRRITMQDDDLKNLCKQIYRKHRKAIDLINDYGVQSEVLSVCEEQISNNFKIGTSQIARARYWFLPQDIEEVSEEVAGAWPFLDRRYPLMYWYHYNQKMGKLHLTMEIGPMLDSQLRHKLILSIPKKEFKLSKKALSESAKYTRIITKTRTFDTEDGEPKSDPEYIGKVAIEMYDSLAKHTKLLHTTLSQFEWP